MRRLMLLLATAVTAIALPVMAQTKAPAGLEPIPEPPPPPAGFDPSLEPQVTITQRGGDKIEEHRVNGKLYMIKVTPPHGVPYYLVDNRGDGTWTRPDATESGLRVPMWVIKSF